MTRSNLTHFSPLDENPNRTLRLLARGRELEEARRRIEEGEQPQVGPKEEIVVEEDFDSEEEGSVANMAANQHDPGGSSVEEQARTMGYYIAPRVADIQLTIRHPAVAANNFEIKPALVTMIQNNALFHGLSNEFPREHVQKFVKLAGSLKINGVPEDGLKLRLCPYSLAENASRWLKNRPILSITSWDDMLNKWHVLYYTWEMGRAWAGLQRRRSGARRSPTLSKRKMRH
ncbi:unnamed protein product [Linum trigynum]|uniref:Retrotransposon gag domain-containing protein n=1 Tax=Linum trigynum TaxID=586398 RepID=A0AAV2CGC3_9ROSI